MGFEEAREVFFSTIRRTQYLGSAASLLYWDMLTIMPKKGAEARARAIGAVEGELFRLSTSDEFGKAINALLERQDKLTPRERRMLEEASFEYNRFKKIPVKMFDEFSALKPTSTAMWTQAKQTNDFELFKPYLDKVIGFSRDFAEIWGYKDKPYDAMLEGYDQALLTAQIDPIFEKLLSGTRGLMKKTGENVKLPKVSVTEEAQQKVGEYLLKTMGYDLDAGNLYTTEHPFTNGIHAGDVRVTTKYHPEAPLSSIFSVLHEGGHGMYDQNISPELDGTNLCDGSSMGIHESQSRFWENIIGRSRGFWSTRLQKLNELSGAALASNPDEFYRGINAVTPSLIRIEADELTYNLHIITRYECEKAIFNDKLSVGALPELWREKYREYLGVVPETYNQGILQDVHWSDGMFGYFPSYAIGNLCSAQFANAFEKEHGALENHTVTDDGLAIIAAWLKENIHKHGREPKPAELMLRVCGEDINPDYFLDYMDKKISDVYGR